MKQESMHRLTHLIWSAWCTNWTRHQSSELTDLQCSHHSNTPVHICFQCEIVNLQWLRCLHLIKCIWSINTPVLSCLRTAVLLDKKRICSSLASIQRITCAIKNGLYCWMSTLFSCSRRYLCIITLHWG